MRRLQPIPTRRRRSDWWLVEGEIRLHRKAKAHRWIGGGLEFRTVDGDSKVLISRSDSRQALETRRTMADLWYHAEENTSALGDAEDVVLPARLLVRNIKFADGDWAHDLCASFENKETISILDGVACDNDSMKGPTLEVLKILIGQGKKIEWPEWLPNDEAMPLEEHNDPEDLDPEIWGAVKDSLMDAHMLEDDQVYYDLKFSRIQVDNCLDHLRFICDLEETLGIKVPEEVLQEADSESGTVGSFCEALVALTRAQAGNHQPENT